MSRKSLFVEVCDTQVFSLGDSVEALAFDIAHRRLVATSHNGSIKMFCLDRDGRYSLSAELLNVDSSCIPGVLPTALWTAEHPAAIPRSVHFLNSGEDIIVYGLESGEMQVWFQFNYCVN